MSRRAAMTAGPASSPVPTPARPTARWRRSGAPATGCACPGRAHQGIRPITILFADGTYPVTGPVTFEPADGGTASAPVVYQAEPGAHPVLDGGRPITGFTRRPDGLWAAQVPDVAEGRFTFEQLFVNGRRATRAGTPGQFYHYMLKRVNQAVDPETGKPAPMENRAFVAGRGPRALAGTLPAATPRRERGGLSLLGNLAPPDRFGRSPERRGGPDGPGPVAVLRLGAESEVHPRECPQGPRPARQSGFLARGGTLTYKPLHG